MFAVDWGLRLRTVKKVDAGITHVGIRGHWLRPVSEKGENCMPVAVEEYIETTFEHQYLVRNAEDENSSPLWWMRPKGSFGEDTEGGMPEYLYLPPEEIMLLRE